MVVCCCFVAVKIAVLFLLLSGEAYDVVRKSNKESAQSALIAFLRGGISNHFQNDGHVAAEKDIILFSLRTSLRLRACQLS
ncbi:hypothetical protein IWX90DRAFT_152447 [Phyllosticta citrichinensis]|uniref:Secreted protein n=1 Tax=Phyllosticta citrichinensis TaxID=1130410 RepID=A0ABR1Y020_9PEZI